MGTLKLEVNIPEFDKEITIEVTLKKDGKVTCKGVTAPTSSLPVFEESQTPEPKKNLTNPSVSSLMQGGNMMNADF